MRHNPRPPERAGRFITFEGPEGAGKSTQVRLLGRWLAARGRQAVLTREPGGTEIGDLIREVLFGPHRGEPLGLTEALLMNASRAQLVHEVILPALSSGQTVVCDRYADATLAYQGYGRGLDLQMLRQLIAIATGGLRPHLIIYLDVAPVTGLARKAAGQAAGEEMNHMDLLDVAFHQRVVEGYRRLAAEDPDRWRIINGDRDPEAIQAEIQDVVAGCLGAP